MARKPKGTAKNMTDLAAELGLEEAVTTTAPVADASAPAEDNSRKAVKIGEIKRGRLSAIPTITRGGSDTDSKYAEFGKLEAPDASGFDSAFVEYDPADTEERFSRSVQAAYTKETAAAKAAGKPNKYIGRRVVGDDGKLQGIYVIRVDGSQDAAEDDVAEQTAE